MIGSDLLSAKDHQEVRMKVLNFGSLNLDYVYTVERFVKPKETMSALSQQIHAGGKGLNQSVALARAGTDVWHAGCIGIGGSVLKDLLEKNHVHCEYLMETEMIQGNAVIQVDAKGENCILLFGGSNRCISDAQIRSTLDAFDKGDWLIVQNEINSLKQIVEEAYRRGMQIVLNPSPYDHHIEELDLNMITWLIMNELEAEQLTGFGDAVKAWEHISAKYPSLNVVITLGEEGSYAFSAARETVYQPAFPVSAVDTTGAGDTFTGYFVSGLAAGLSLAECMETAGAAAAISVTRAGAADSIPDREETAAWLKREKQ